jgi:hypothetical protein
MKVSSKTQIAVKTGANISKIRVYRDPKEKWRFLGIKKPLLRPEMALFGPPKATFYNCVLGLFAGGHAAPSAVSVSFLMAQVRP